MGAPFLAVDSPLLSIFPQGGSTTHNELLLVALLMALWLLVRVRRQEQARRPPPRRAPTSLNELGAIVFQTARSSDVLAFRGLFLAGGEASQVLGEGAAAYLERRSLASLQESLASIAALLPEGARYDGVEQIGPDSYAMWVAPPAGERMLVSIGTAVRVGALWRLRDPPFLGAGALPLPAQPTERAPAQAVGQGALG